MGKKIPGQRLNKLKQEHRKKKQKEDKYQKWLSCSFPILDTYCGQYQITDWLRKIL